MQALPNFSLSDYHKMLVSLKKSGYSFGLITNKTPDKKTVYLRHDLDYFPYEAYEMSKIEQECFIVSTYYILLNDYNITTRTVIEFLRSLIRKGNEIGLHYDLSQYPKAKKSKFKFLHKELKILESVVGRKIVTGCSHAPSLRRRNFTFCNDIVNPVSRDFLKDVVYISDSSRAWRDESLLKCFEKNGPRQVLLSIHPGSWLNGNETDRIKYFRETVVRKRKQFYSDEEWESRWIEIHKNHEGAKIHDERINGL